VVSDIHIDDSFPDLGALLVDARVFATEKDFSRIDLKEHIENTKISGM